MSIRCLIVLINAIAILLLTTVGCSDGPADSSTSQSLKDPEELFALLERGALDEFYHGINKENISALRTFLEEKARQGRVFNYGILVNADIVTHANRKLFKPDIKAVQEFVTVTNESRCYMNATLYNLANSAFLDDLFEIDTILSKKWARRPEKNRNLANKILRTLRETIYEIRRGHFSAPEKIAAMRARHLKVIESLNDLDIVTDLYRELLLSYEFEKIEVVSVDAHGNPSYAWRDGPLAKSEVDDYDLREAVSRFKIYDGYGMLGGLAKNLGSNKDIIYLDAIFPLIDPWGKMVHYLAGAKFDTSLNSSVLRTLDPYEIDWSELILASARRSENIKLIHNPLIFLPDGSIDLSLKRLVRKGGEEKGYMTLDYPVAMSNHRLVARSKYSSNHLISEVFRYSKNGWERQDFFGPPRFSTTQSPVVDGNYQDHLYFVEITSP